MRVGEESNTILNTSKVEEEDFNCCNGPNMTHPMCFPIGWYQYHHIPKLLNEYYSYVKHFQSNQSSPPRPITL